MSLAGSPVMGFFLPNAKASGTRRTIEKQFKPVFWLKSFYISISKFLDSKRIRKCFLYFVSCFL